MGYNPAVSDNKRLLRTIVMAVVVLGILAIISQLLTNYFTKGQIVAVSNNPSITITLSNLSTGKLIVQSKEKLTATVHTGEYLLAATDSSGAVQQIATIKAHHTVHYSISPSPTSSMEPVSDGTSQDIIADNSHVLFLNSDGNLSEIDTDNSLKVINTSISFKTIQWINSGYGVGQDKNGLLYSIIDGSIEPLNITIPNRTDWPLYAVAPNHQIYIAVGTAVYKADSAGRLQQIYTAASDPTLLVAGNTEVIAISSHDSSDSLSSNDKNSAVIAIIGKKTIKKNISTFTAALSPDEKYLAVSTTKGGEILDTNLNKVAALTTSNLGTPVWLSGTVLAYSVNDQLWSYDVTSQRSQLLSNAPLKGTITELSMSSDGAYIYAGVTHIQSAPVIKRFGLHNQPVSATLNILQNIMPYTGSDYFMTLTNFTKPMITVQPVTPLTNTNSQYIQEATKQLQQLGIDTSQVEIKLVIPS